MSGSSFAGTLQSELPLILDHIEEADGHYRIQYYHPPDGYTVPALAGIQVQSYEIVNPPKREGGGDVRIVKISKFDFQQICERVKAAEEIERFQKYLSYWQGQKVKTTEKLRDMQCKAPDVRSSAYHAMCRTVISVIIGIGAVYLTK
ncbi:hypothetical protein DPSP01_014577 [Paraphaeosphaeria sporulosa]